MPGKTIKIRSSEGGEFDCYLATPGDGKVPAIVLASAVHGVDKDIREIADEFAAARLYRGRARFVLALGAGPARRARTARGRALAAAAREDQGRRSRHGGHARRSAQAAAIQRPRGGDGLLLRRALRDPRAEAARLRRRHRLPRHAVARLHQGARRRHRAGLHHLGRPGPRARLPRCWPPIAMCRRA